MSGTVSLGRDEQVPRTAEKSGGTCEFYIENGNKNLDNFIFYIIYVIKIEQIFEIVLDGGMI